LFAALSAAHTVISPFREQHDLIADWCERHDVPLDHVEFVAAKSQDVIHQLDPKPLDAVLIDGGHAFPIPFIDWYYTADRLAEEGLAVVDDTQIATGAILRDFLSAEQGRWDLAAELGKTAVFRRITADAVADGVPWFAQPYSAAPTRGGTLMRTIWHKLRGSR
jgi:predicted O-methyltransferase YrrM